jgi:AraC-like DNA-binding protein
MDADDAVKNPAVGIIVHRDPQHPDYPEHKHDDFDEIVIIEAGTAISNINGHDFALTAGEVSVLPLDTRHSYHATCNLSLVNLCFKRSALAPFASMLNQSPGFQALFNVQPSLKKKGIFLGRLHLDSAQMAAANRLIDQLQTELEGSSPLHQLMGSTLFAQFVAALSRWYETPKSSRKTDSQVLHLARVISHIETHFNQPIKTEELAKISGMSLRNFYRAFNEAFEESPSNYINRIRILKAVELMKDPRKNITDIAFETGFNDSNYFTRAFKKIMNQSPSAHRRPP